MSTSSFCALRWEQTPRFEDAPTTDPFRLSTVRHYFPIVSGRIQPEPQLRDRNDELRGNLSPMPSIVDSIQATGAITVAAYMSKAIPLIDLAGMQMTATQGDGANEVQRITPGGTISGGTWDLAVSALAAFTITAIPYNVTAAQLQELVDRKIRRGGTGHKLGDVVVGGGPLPGSFLTLTFQGTKACQNVAQSTVVTASLTGSSPTLTVSTTTAGSVGTVVLPDGTGIPTGVYRWVGTKRTGATPQSAEVLAAYQENGVFELGQGMAVSQLAFGEDGNLAATLAGLVAIAVDDPALTPSHDGQAVHPMLSRDLLVTWPGGGGSVSGLTWSISNPFEAVRNFGIRSAWAGILRYVEGFVTATGSVNLDAYDEDDRIRFVEASTFAMRGHWMSASKIGATGSPYQMFFDAPACQLVGGAGPEDLGARRNFGASYDWQAGYDETAGHDFKVTCTSALSTLATYI